MAAVMDLDLNCAPPSPEPAPQDHRINHAMLRQEHAFRHQVKDLHRLYWAQRNLPHDVPFWEQSHDVLYPTHSHSMDASSSHMIHPDLLGASYEQLGKQAIRFGNGNLGPEGSVMRRPDHGGVQDRSGYRRMIDLEKPATSEDDDDDVQILSPSRFSDYANHRNAGFVDNSQHRPPRENATHVSFGSTGSSYTPYSQSPVKAKATPSGRMLIDLNIAQEDDCNVRPDSSKVPCSLLASSSTMQSGEWCNNSSKAFPMGGESSIGSSKGSSITAVASISAPDNAREVMARGICDPQSSSKPFHAEASNHDMRLRGNIQHQHTLDNVSGMSSQASVEIPREEISVRASGQHSFSSSGLQKSGGPPAAVYRECQEETLAVICDGEMEGFDLNVSVGSIELPSMMDCSPREKHTNGDGVDKLLSQYFTEDKGQENVSSVECSTVIDQQHSVTESMDGKSVRSPDSGVATNRSMSIPETPQGRDYACPRLRSSNPMDAASVHHQPVTEDELIASTAAETLVSLFTDTAAWITDSHCSNNQADAQDGGSDEPQVSLDSFEEGVMNLETLRDDGDSVCVSAPDKDGPSCGIKLRRGRGMRDFQREILPGLVSLARHEICDDLHAIGYELRKTRQRRAPGDKYGPSTRSRLPRRCSNAWN